MTNERAFWEQMLRTMNPQWNVAIPGGNPPGAPNIAQLTVRIYLVDTSNDWVLMGAVSEEDARTARRQTAAQPSVAEQIVGSLGLLLSECSDGNIDKSSPKAEGALSASLLAMSHSRTFDQVRQQTGALSGHWLYLLYRLNTGAMLARPGFVGAKGCGLLRLEELGQAVRRIVTMDLASSGSVAAQIRRDGGLRLSPGLERATGDSKPR